MLSAHLDEDVNPKDMAMAKKKAELSGESLAEMRKKSGMNQSAFWQRFGITQSAGSRYESGRGLPNPAKILIALYLAGRVNDEDLATARKSAGVRSGATGA